MAISTETRRSDRYACDGVQTAFPFAFKVFKANEIGVIVSPDGETETSLSSELYTVSLNEDQDNNPGGVVNLLTAPADGTILVVVSNVAYKQQIVFTNQGGFYPELLNEGYDRLTILTQQLKEHLSRTLTFPVTSDTDAEQLVSDLLSAGIAARKVIPYLDDIRGVAGITDEVESLFENLQKLVAIADNIDALIRVEGIIEDIQQIADNVVLAQAAAEAAEAAAAEIESKLADVEGVFEENKVLIQLTDTYLLTVLNTAATASWNFTVRDIEAYWKWYQDGLDKLQQVATIALHTAEATENDIEHFVAWFTKAEEDETRLLKLLSQTSERSRQLVEMHISDYDDDIRTRNLLIRVYVEKPYDLFIVAGQSNAVGSGGQPPIEDASWSGMFWNWRYQESKKLDPLKDPVYASTSKSAWPSFGRKWFELTGRKVIILNVAKGGAVVTDTRPGTDKSWYGDDAPCRQVATREWMALKTYLISEDIDYKLRGLIWSQGEWDARFIESGATTVNDYREGTISVFDFFAELTEAPHLSIFISETGLEENCLSNPSLMTAYSEVQKVQSEIAGDRENCWLAYQGAKHFLQAGMMNDYVHYNQAGYNEMGCGLARFISYTTGD